MRSSLHSERKASVVAGKAVEASEDGDFVALRQMREKRQNLNLDEGFQLPHLPEIVESPEGERPIRPISAKPRPGSAKSGSQWEKLTEAANSSVDNFREAVNKVTAGHSLTDGLALDPHTGQNILHYVLELHKPDLLGVLLAQADVPLIQQAYDVTVTKINGKKNCLHKAVEMGDLDLLKQLLAKIPQKTVRNQLLLQETPVGIQGQRPRTFPCLHLAAFHGHTGVVLYLLEQQGLDVNHLNAKKDTALLWAARWGHRDTALNMLKKGALPGVENDKGSTALYWAVRYGHTDTVQLLAEEGKADVHQVRKLGFVSPIVLASALGLMDIVGILLRYGADPNFEIRGGERPIHQVGREGHTQVAKLLLRSGADIDAPDERGDTSMLLAAKYGRAATLQLLLKEGASLSHKNIMGEDVWTHAVDSDNDLIIKLLVIHQRTLDMEGEELAESSLSTGTNSLLCMAASYGNCDRIELLREMKMDMRATDNEGNNFLHFAAINNRPKVVKKFYKLGNIDGVNTLGNTPLHEACFRGRHEVTLQLIKVKAVANVRNNKGETALHVAAYCEHIQPTTVAKLTEYVIKTHPWESLNIKDNEGNNPLHIAAKNARPDVLWQFRFIRFKDPDVDFNLPLHESVRPGDPDCLDTMLDIYDAMKRDCDINWQNKKQETTLHLAAKCGFIEGVKRLILFGADISLADCEGNTVLHLLTLLSINDSSHCIRYLELMDAILERASQWYVTRYSQKVNDSDEDKLAFVRRRAILELTTDIPNKADMSVLGLACKVGASEVLEKLYSLDQVFSFQIGRYTRYDVSFLTPKTNGTLGGQSKHNTVSPRPSCLEWLLATGMDAPHNAAKVLDTQPFSNIEGSYGLLAAWTYVIIMVVHIVYMILHSWSGVTLLDKSRRQPGVRTVDSATVVLYTIIPVEPAFIMLYHLFQLTKRSCLGEISLKTLLNSGNWKTFLYSVITVSVSFIHSLLAVLWIAVYAMDYQFMDNILSISLCIGWLYTIAFTRGLRVINYFWRLIQIMIVKDVFRFMVIYLFVLLAFSFAFHAQFQISPTIVSNYPTPINTLFMMFNMMIGMDYVFEDGSVETGLETAGKSTVPIKLYFIIYMVMGTIVLLNLLIAMMNDSYQAILQKRRMLWRIESVKLGVDVERSIPPSFSIFSKVHVREGYMCPTDEAHQIQRWHIDVLPEKPIESEVVDDEAEKGAITELRVKLDNVDVRMAEQFQSLKTGMDDLHNTLRAMEKVLGGKMETKL